MSDIREIEWTKNKLDKFKARYMVAVGKEEETFKFEDHEFVVEYAKYMVEFLDNEFSK